MGTDNYDVATVSGAVTMKFLFREKSAIIRFLSDLIPVKCRF